MTPRLTKMPYEILSAILEYVTFEDFVNLAHTSKDLLFLEKNEAMCKKVLYGKLPFCDEAIEAQKVGCGYASAMRRVAKRYEAIATASPFSVAIVGVADYFIYYCGNLCYIVDSTLRILNLHKAEHDEVVISIPALLAHVVSQQDQRVLGRFKVLYYSHNIISCLYTSSAIEHSYVVAFHVSQRKLLHKGRLSGIDRIFARHDSKYIYVGTYSRENFRGQKEWKIDGYCFETQKGFEESIILSDFYGREIGATVCFEIFDGYFYAVSNQSSHEDEVEEVDWTSFYHCIRFPVASPSRILLERTAMDEHTWRRQHREGVMDDRGTALWLQSNAATNDLMIVETRVEWNAHGKDLKRVIYSTKVVFGERNPCSSPIQLWRRGDDSSILAALTNDRLAFTIGTNNNPHWYPPQVRLPANVHLTSYDRAKDSISKVRFQYYNHSAQYSTDLVVESLPGTPDRQRLRLRIDSRKLDPPARNENGVVIREQHDAFTARKVALWPAEQLPEQDNKGLVDLDTLLNPLGHLGNVEAFGDERSVVYSIGGKDIPKAIVFIGFDPATRLKGSRSWYEQIPRSDECNTVNRDRKTEKSGKWGGRQRDKDWIWKEPAMYQAIDRSYNFGATRKT